MALRFDGHRCAVEALSDSRGGCSWVLKGEKKNLPLAFIKRGRQGRRGKGGKGGGGGGGGECTQAYLLLQPQEKKRRRRRNCKEHFYLQPGQLYRQEVS